MTRVAGVDAVWKISGRLRSKTSAVKNMEIRSGRTGGVECSIDY